MKAEFKWDEDHLYEDCSIMAGGIKEAPNWEEYLSISGDKIEKYLEAAKECVLNTEGMLGMTGQQAENGHFLFEDGKTMSFSYRAWGDFMQAIVGKREGYMTYYM